jgi:hypothetical protein
MEQPRSVVCGGSVVLNYKLPIRITGVPLTAIISALDTFVFLKN